MTTSAIKNAMRALPFSQHTLANGLRVVIVPRRSASIVNITVAYRVGSKDEHPDHTGFAHLFEHLMFEGSDNLANGLFDRYCTAAGGNNNAFTTHDSTVYYMVLPSHQLELGLWLEADRMAAFGVDQAALQTQQNVVIEEISQNVENQPYGSFSRALSQTAFRAGSPYGWDVYGSVEHVRNSTLDDVNAFFRRHYRPDNACLVISGNVDPEQGLELARKYFEAIPRGEQALRRVSEGAQDRRTSIETRVEDNIPLEGIFRVYHFDGFSSDDIYTANILTSILSDGQSSRLYSALVYEQKIASEVGVYVDDRELSSLLVNYAIAAEPEITAAELDAALSTVLNEVAQNGVEEREMHKAQNRTATRLARTMQRNFGVANEIAFNTLYFDDPARAFAMAEKYAAVTADDVQAFARKVCRRDNSVGITFVPKSS